MMWGGSKKEHKGETPHLSDFLVLMFITGGACYDFGD
jgi:hypothetical protein